MGGFNVGDIVYVKSSLIVNEVYRMNGDYNKYSGYYFVDEMEVYRGKIAVIKRVKNNSYNLDIDDCKYGWTDEMLESRDNRRTLSILNNRKCW